MVHYGMQVTWQNMRSVSGEGLSYPREKQQIFGKIIKSSRIRQTEGANMTEYERSSIECEVFGEYISRNNKNNSYHLSPCVVSHTESRSLLTKL